MENRHRAKEKNTQRKKKAERPKKAKFRMHEFGKCAFSWETCYFVSFHSRRIFSSFFFISFGGNLLQTNSFARISHTKRIRALRQPPYCCWPSSGVSIVDVHCARVQPSKEPYFDYFRQCFHHKKYIFAQSWAWMWARSDTGTNWERNCLLTIYFIVPSIPLDCVRCQSSTPSHDVRRRFREKPSAAQRYVC